MNFNNKYFFNKIVKKLFFTALWLFLASLTMAQEPKKNMIVISDSLKNGKFVQHFRCGFDTAQINYTLQKYLERYANSGYPFAKTVCDSIVVNQQTGRFYFSVKKGNYYKIENIFLPGKPKITPYYIYRTIHLKPGEEFSHRKLTRANALINNTGILKTTQQAQPEFHPNDADIYLYIQKQKCNSAEAGIALMYNPQKERYYPTGNATLMLANNLGKGETFGFEWHGYKENSQKLSAEIRLPYLFGTAISAEGNTKINKTDSTCVFVAINPAIEVGLSDVISVKADVSSTWLIPQNEQSTIEKSNSTLYGADILWLCTFHNSILKASVGAATGKRNNNGEKYNCQELRMSLLYNRTLWQRFEISSITSSKVKLCDAETYIYEKYRFGGASTLRGFNEEYFFADRYILLSNTLRYRPYDNFSIFTFYDLATYQCNSANDTPQGMGIGAGLRQNYADIDIAWAIGREHNEYLPLKQAKIHITVKLFF